MHVCFLFVYICGQDFSLFAVSFFMSTSLCFYHSILWFVGIQSKTASSTQLLLTAAYCIADWDLGVGMGVVVAVGVGQDYPR